MKWTLKPSLFYFGEAWMVAVEKVWKKKTGRDDFWDVAEQKYGYYPTAYLDSKYDYYPFDDIIKDYDLSEDDIWDILVEIGFDRNNSSECSYVTSSFHEVEVPDKVNYS